MRLPSLFSRKSPKSTLQFSAPIAPETAFVAVGDVHGECQLLEQTLQAVQEVEPELPIICVGDYIDRGEDSRAVLELLHGLTKDKTSQVMCLMGNHEQMLLRFLDDPEARGPAWLRYGGLQTLASYQIANDASGLRGVRDKLAAAIGIEIVEWLRNLPLVWTTGNIAVTHAGADPRSPVDNQPDRALLWGHADFETVPRGDGVWVVHGHTIVDEACATDGRIAIDTGAYATGTMTAAKISKDGVSFLVTTKS